MRSKLLLMTLMYGGAGMVGSSNPSPCRRGRNVEKLPEGFVKFTFDRETGELLNGKLLIELRLDEKVYSVTSRSEEKAREQFDKVKKKRNW